MSEDAIIRRLRIVADTRSFTMPPAVRALLNEAADDIQSYEQSFELRWSADMRAIKRWQDAAPGRELTWPDHADLCVWLMEQLEAAAVELVECKQQLLDAQIDGARQL